jgi:hypothetical protein
MASETVTFSGNRVVVMRRDGCMIVCTVLAIETYQRLFGLPLH